MYLWKHPVQVMYSSESSFEGQNSLFQQIISISDVRFSCKCSARIGFTLHLFFFFQDLEIQFVIPQEDTGFCG